MSEQVRRIANSIEFVFDVSTNGETLAIASKARDLFIEALGCAPEDPDRQPTLDEADRLSAEAYDRLECEREPTERMLARNIWVLGLAIEEANAHGQTETATRAAECLAEDRAALANLRLAQPT